MRASRCGASSARASEATGNININIGTIAALRIEKPLQPTCRRTML
jgi:hypothetical protein